MGLRVTFCFASDRLRTAERRLLLDTLQRLNEIQLAEQNARGAAPPPVDEIAHYQREAKGHEDWQTAEALQASGRGDCEDLSGYEAAWRSVVHHERCRISPRLHELPGGGLLVHLRVRVRRDDGSSYVSDPSRRLGM